ncbi:MAG: hypothetical protein WB615_02665 [Candidatus Tumulicola sp.]
MGTTGDLAPSQYIKGPKTGLSEPVDVAVDSSGNIYVANNVGGSDNGGVTVYAAGTTGNVKPIATISGDSTEVCNPTGVAIDPVNGDIYVENYCPLKSGGRGSVTFYAPGSNGNVAPLGEITGSQLDTSGGLTLDGSGNIYVPNETSIDVYAAGSSGDDIAPTQTITGQNTGLDDPHQVALDSSLNLYAANLNGTNSTITVYPPGANGNVSPSETIGPKKAALNGAAGVALDGNGNIYAASSGNNTITIYPAGSNGKVRPSGTIRGRDTKLKNPSGIAIR